MSGEARSIINTSRTGSGQAGQATVLFALALPIVLLGMTQVGVAIRNELAVELAAREGAQAASVSASPHSATVTYVDPTDVPIMGQFIGPSTHQATATMALEP